MSGIEKNEDWVKFGYGYYVGAPWTVGQLRGTQGINHTLRYRINIMLSHDDVNNANLRGKNGCHPVDLLFFAWKAVLYCSSYLLFFLIMVGEL